MNFTFRKGGPCGRPIVYSITCWVRTATRAAPTVFPYGFNRDTKDLNFSTSFMAGSVSKRLLTSTPANIG